MLINREFNQARLSKASGPAIPADRAGREMADDHIAVQQAFLRAPMASSLQSQAD